jgi:hypothetical protein
MKQQKNLKKVLIVGGMFIASSAGAHPYDAPLTFRKHLTDDGRVIYSNIPKKCFSRGVLTCGGLHPIYGMPVSMKSTVKTKKIKTRPIETKSDTPQVEQAKTTPEAPPDEPVQSVKLSEGGICHQKGEPSYNRTRKPKDRFQNIDECLDAGGRLPKTLIRQPQ